MATTLEKMQALQEELRATALSDTGEDVSGFVEAIQIAAGMGIDVFDIVFPKTEPECSVFVDQMIAMFLRVRGDDLPPFSPTLYGDVVEEEPAGA